MNERIKCDFLKKRMIELREKNGKSQAEMAELIGCNKSTLSRAEKIGGETGYKTVRGFAEDYCDKLGLTTEQKSLFLRGEKIVVIDTSALLKNPQLIDELCKEYSQVIVPKTVIDELDHIKNRNANGLASKAWQLLKSIRFAICTPPFRKSLHSQYGVCLQKTFLRITLFGQKKDRQK